MEGVAGQGGWEVPGECLVDVSFPEGHGQVMEGMAAQVGSCYGLAVRLPERLFNCFGKVRLGWMVLRRGPHGALLSLANGSYDKRCL
jgi:hypothetical protein